MAGGKSHHRQAADVGREIKSDDPRLKGRIFTFAADEISSNFLTSEACVQPAIDMKRISAAGLIKESMLESPPVSRTPKDFQLSFDDAATAYVFFFRCEGRLWNGALGPENGIRGSWVILMPEERLALRWHDETILVLKPVSSDARPEASFRCRNASIAAEKAICGSVALASFDQSIAEPYARAVRSLRAGKKTADLKKLRSIQKRWLVERNACGANVECLEKSMRDHLEILAHPEKLSRK